MRPSTFNASIIIKMDKLLYSFNKSIVTKKKGEIFSTGVNPQCWAYRLNVYCWSLTETERFASSITSSSKSLQILKFYCLIYMDHKGSVSLLISFLKVNKLLNGNGSSYPNNRNPIDTNLTTSHGSCKRLNRNYGHNQWV